MGKNKKKMKNGDSLCLFTEILYIWLIFIKIKTNEYQNNNGFGGALFCIG